MFAADEGACTLRVMHVDLESAAITQVVDVWMQTKLDTVGDLRKRLAQVSRNLCFLCASLGMLVERPEEIT